MTAVHRIAGFGVAVAVGAGLVWGSHVPLKLETSEDAVLRLAWAVRPERIETCHELTEKELAAVPKHMQQQRICEGVAAQYRLLVRDERGIRIDRVHHGGGLRQDRRLYVFEELPLQRHSSVEVTFERVNIATDEDEDEADERDDAIPAAMSLVVPPPTGPREVTLVTYDPGRRALVAVRRSTGGH
jgi:hypothetical protein